MPVHAEGPAETLAKDENRAPGRKAAETRIRIALSAYRLFLEQGFAETTVEQIAAAASVSRRTFFHHFEAKQAVLQLFEEKLEDKFRVALQDFPSDGAPAEAARRAVMFAIGLYYESEQAIALDRLMRSTETLRAHRQANFEARERALLRVLVERWPDASLISLEMVAIASIGALRVAVEQWSLARTDTIGGFFDKALLAIGHEMRELSLANRPV